MANRIVVVASNYAADPSGPFHAATTSDTLTDGNGTAIMIGTAKSDRYLFYAEDTQYNEAGTGYVTKKTFRFVMDSAKKPNAWKCIVSLWGDSGATAEVMVNMGTDSLSSPIQAINQTSEVLGSGTITVAAAADTILTATIQLRRQTGGSIVYVQYTAIYAVYT